MKSDPSVCLQDWQMTAIIDKTGGIWGTPTFEGATKLSNIKNT